MKYKFLFLIVVISTSCGINKNKPRTENLQIENLKLKEQKILLEKNINDLQLELTKLQEELDEYRISKQYIEKTENKAVEFIEKLLKISKNNNLEQWKNNLSIRKLAKGEEYCKNHYNGWAKALIKSFDGKNLYELDIIYDNSNNKKSIIINKLDLKITVTIENDEFKIDEN